jgi:AcrR family transcriptional regulator
MAPARSLRADALRNRQRVLAAAREAFATRGLGVPIDEIARRAGVGAGTVYRHFPTKESLYEAILAEHVEALAAEARTLAAGDRPGEAFFEFLASFADRGAGNRALADALAGAGVDVDSRLTEYRRSLYAAVKDLLASAQSVGAVRPDIGSEDLFGLLSGVHAAVERSGDATMIRRLIGVVSDGLRTWDRAEAGSD